MKYHQRFIEAQRRIEWYIDGYHLHCIPHTLFKNMPTERIVELYNVDMTYFRPMNCSCTDYKN